MSPLRMPTDDDDRLLRRYVGGGQGRRGTFQPWGGRQPTPGAGGRPQGCCGLNARAAASDLLVEEGTLAVTQVFKKDAVRVSSTHLSLSSRALLVLSGFCFTTIQNSFVRPTTWRYPWAQGMLRCHYRDMLVACGRLCCLCRRLWVPA